MRNARETAHSIRCQRRALRPALAARIRAALAALAALAAFTGPAAALDRELEMVAGGHEASEITLAVGDSLIVSARSLAAGATADFVLRDGEGLEITRLRVRADAKGETAPEFLWWRTGIAGCDDCLSTSASFPETPRFAQFETAERALVGKVWSVELTDSEGSALAPPHRVHFTVTAGTQVYWSDSQGCPRRAFGPGEAVYLALRGPATFAAAEVEINVDRPDWSLPLDLADARTWVGPEGERLEFLSTPLPLGVQLTIHPIAGGDLPSLSPGFYSAEVRTESIDPHIRERWIVSSSRFLLRSLSTEEGVVIIDWGACRPRP